MGAGDYGLALVDAVAVDLKDKGLLGAVRLLWGMAWGVSTTCHGQVSIGKLRVVDSSLLWSLTPSAHSSKTLAPPLAPVTGEAIRPTTDAPRAPATDTFRPKSTSKVAASRHSRTHMRAIPFEPWLAIRVGRPR